MTFRFHDYPRSDNTTPGPQHRRSPCRPAVLLAALLLSGCAGGAAVPAGNGDAGVQAAPLDPVLAFAATAAPGAEGQVVLMNTGRRARVRLLRSYHAGSGRECREVLVGSGSEERATLACQDGTAWVATRPLLGGRGFGPR